MIQLCECEYVKIVLRLLDWGYASFTIPSWYLYLSAMHFKYTREIYISATTQGTRAMRN